MADFTAVGVTQLGVRVTRREAAHTKVAAVVAGETRGHTGVVVVGVEPIGCAMAGITFQAGWYVVVRFDWYAVVAAGVAGGATTGDAAMAKIDREPGAGAHMTLFACSSTDRYVV